MLNYQPSSQENSTPLRSPPHRHFHLGGGILSSGGHESARSGRSGGGLGSDGFESPHMSRSGGGLGSEGPESARSGRRGDGLGTEGLKSAHTGRSGDGLVSEGLEYACSSKRGGYLGSTSLNHNFVLSEGPSREGQTKKYGRADESSRIDSDAAGETALVSGNLDDRAPSRD